MDLPDDKPVSVLHLATKRQPFLLAGDLSPAPATYPELVTERAAPGPLFGLAPHGVCPAGAHYCRRGALLPHLFTLTRQLLNGRYVFCGTIRKTRFERAPPAVSRHAALWRPDFPPRKRSLSRRPERLPVRQARSIMACAVLNRNRGKRFCDRETFEQSGVSPISWCILSTAGFSSRV